MILRDLRGLKRRATDVLFVQRGTKMLRCIASAVSLRTEGKGRASEGQFQPRRAARRARFAFHWPQFRLH